MSTVPDRPDEVRADQIQPGAILPLDIGDASMVKVVAVTAYTDSDGADMAALTVTPIGGGKPQIVQCGASWRLELASEAEIAEHRDGERRRELAAALVDLADRIERERLPLGPGWCHPEVVVLPDTRAELDQWAAEFGATVKVGDNRIPVIRTNIGPLHIRVQSDPEPIETSTGDTSASVAGAEVGAAPSGPGVPAPGPDIPAVEWPGERPAEPGEVCTCGKPATTVFTDGQYGDTGWCGTRDGAGDRCPWCDCPDPHAGRCPNYRLRPDTQTAAERADLPGSADAAATGTEGPVADAAAAPAAPAPDAGAAGVTPPVAYDLMPACTYGPGEQRTAFMEAHARGLDLTRPGWHRCGLDRMDPDLVPEAKARRRAEWDGADQ